MSAAVTPGRNDEAAPQAVPGGRLWLAAAGVLALAVTLVPPVVTLARQYVFVESIQFLVFAMAAPALIVLGAPWRFLRLSRAAPNPPAGALAGGTAGEAPAGAGPLDRLAAGGRGTGRSCARRSSCWCSSAPAWSGGCRR